MDYSKLSDFEINAAVFETLHGGSPDHKEGDGGAMVLISYEVDVVGGDAVEVEVERGVFNPCNNAAEAWPIIVENRLYIDPIYASDWSVSSECDSFREIHKNPLRAAMIVFLMMQESANVQDNPA